MKKHTCYLFIFLLCLAGCHHQKTSTDGQTPAVPSSAALNRPFGKHDEVAFQSPPKVYHPGTMLFYIGENVSTQGITTDLEAIAGAGVSSVLLFHGKGLEIWPGVTSRMTFLSDSWDEAIKHTAEECRRLGLRFTTHNCPGFAMAGGPWVEPSQAMRHLVWSRIDVESGSPNIVLSQPQPSDEPWRDYKDIAVLAFPTPLDDTGEPLKPQRVTSNLPEIPWMDCLTGNLKNKIVLPYTSADNPHWVEVTFPETTVLRTIEFSSIREFSNEAWCYDPGVTVTVQAILPDGAIQETLHADLPQSNWQDYSPISLACNEIQDVQTYRLSIATKDNMTFSSLRLFSAARKNNWESEAGWTLRSIVRQNANPSQSQAAFIDPLQIRDITTMMDSQGNLKWDVPSGKWTVLRIGHVNTGIQNAFAPPEGTGWECDKLSEASPDAHFAAYIGRLTGQEGPLANGLLNGMHLDSWECRTQTWTNKMEEEFDRLSGYPLRQWLPAVFGYVVGDHETTTRFLRDWRVVMNDLFTDKFYGRMAQHAKDNGLSVSFETSAGDIFPADILEYYKHADVPMCEFWHPLSETYVGSINFKPIKPAASAARLYGKPRVAAEAFTSFNLTWDEHWDMLKEVANINAVEGVTHFVFHTYTHNPQTNFLPPGTSFGSGTGSPFLRGQTWWKYMPAFTTYLSRCTYLFERGKPVSDVLWYLGDEINHKPNQQAPFPEGIKYDYCNPDVLLNRLSVRDGMLVTPEGIRYRVLWLPDNPRMLPQTLEKLHALINAGATVIGDAPQGLATLSDAAVAQQRFEVAIRNIWGETPGRGLRQSGKGAVISGMTLAEALNELNIQPDVKGGKALWTHRSIDGADCYYVCAPQGSGFAGTLDFRNSTGTAEIWDPVTGDITAADACHNGDRTFVTLDLPQAGSCFVVFRKNAKSATTLSQHETPNAKQIPLTAPWTLTYPEGWGAPPSLQVTALKAWKDLDVPDEAKAFSGTVTYTTTFDIGEIKKGMSFMLDLGRVDMIAAVSLNGRPLRTLWTPPYRLELTEAVLSGTNTLTVEVTGTWFNRLIYDAGQPEDQRKTWTIAGPSKDRMLQESGLLGPVVLTEQESVPQVPASRMQQVYDEVKAPYKYGLVLVDEDKNKKTDCPSVFRYKGSWYMTYIVFDGQGYETWIAQSDNLLDWTNRGKIMSFTSNTWDANQKAGYMALQDYAWGGSYEIEPYNGQYWMSYLGGASEGYEAGTLGIGIAHSDELTAAKEWQRLEHPVMLPGDDDARWYDNRTIFKSTVIHDPAKKLGYPFVMYYNAQSREHNNAERIAMAVSENMTDWKRYGNQPVIDHHTGISGDAFITKMDDLWVMFYFGAFWKPGAFDRFACSYDLVNWTRWNGDDLISPSQPFDNKYAHKPCVVKYNGTVYHFYCAVDNNDNRGIAVATSKDLGKSALEFP